MYSSAQSHPHHPYHQQQPAYPPPPPPSSSAAPAYKTTPQQHEPASYAYGQGYMPHGPFAYPTASPYGPSPSVSSASASWSPYGYPPHPTTYTYAYAHSSPSYLAEPLQFFQQQTPTQALPSPFELNGGTRPPPPPHCYPAAARPNSQSAMPSASPPPLPPAAPDAGLVAQRVVRTRPSLEDVIAAKRRAPGAAEETTSVASASTSASTTRKPVIATENDEEEEGEEEEQTPSPFLDYAWPEKEESAAAPEEKEGRIDEPAAVPVQALLHPPPPPVPLAPARRLMMDHVVDGTETGVEYQKKWLETRGSGSSPIPLGPTPGDGGPFSASGRQLPQPMPSPMARTAGTTTLLTSSFPSVASLLVPSSSAALARIAAPSQHAYTVEQGQDQPTASSPVDDPAIPEGRLHYSLPSHVYYHPNHQASSGQQQQEPGPQLSPIHGGPSFARAHSFSDALAHSHSSSSTAAGGMISRPSQLSHQTLSDPFVVLPSMRGASSTSSTSSRLPLNAKPPTPTLAGSIHSSPLAGTDAATQPSPYYRSHLVVDADAKAAVGRSLDSPGSNHWSSSPSPPASPNASSSTRGGPATVFRTPGGPGKSTSSSRWLSTAFDDDDDGEVDLGGSPWRQGLLSTPAATAAGGGDSTAGAGRFFGAGASASMMLASASFSPFPPGYTPGRGGVTPGYYVGPSTAKKAALNNRDRLLALTGLTSSGQAESPSGPFGGRLGILGTEKRRRASDARSEMSDELSSLGRDDENEEFVEPEKEDEDDEDELEPTEEEDADVEELRLDAEAHPAPPVEAPVLPTSTPVAVVAAQIPLISSAVPQSAEEDELDPESSADEGMETTANGIKCGKRANSKVDEDADFASSKKSSAAGGSVTKKRKRDLSLILAPSSADTEQFPLYGIPPGLRAATKPPHSYAEMIFQALYSHPHRRLSLAALYAWVSAAYPFYRPGDPGWMNSIRHNLSLTPEFQKRERPGDEPGKGNLWHLVEVTEGSVLPGKKSNKKTKLFQRADAIMSILRAECAAAEAAGLMTIGQPTPMTTQPAALAVSPRDSTFRPAPLPSISDVAPAASSSSRERTVMTPPAALAAPVAKKPRKSKPSSSKASDDLTSSKAATSRATPPALLPPPSLIPRHQHEQARRGVDDFTTPLRPLSRGPPATTAAEYRGGMTTDRDAANIRSSSAIPSSLPSTFGGLPHLTPSASSPVSSPGPQTLPRPLRPGAFPTQTSLRRLHDVQEAVDSDEHGVIPDHDDDSAVAAAREPKKRSASQSGTDHSAPSLFQPTASSASNGPLGGGLQPGFQLAPPRPSSAASGGNGASQGGGASSSANGNGDASDRGLPPPSPSSRFAAGAGISFSPLSSIRDTPTGGGSIGAFSFGSSSGRGMGDIFSFSPGWPPLSPIGRQRTTSGGQQTGGHQRSLSHTSELAQVLDSPLTAALKTPRMPMFVVGPPSSSTEINTSPTSSIISTGGLSSRPHPYERYRTSILSADGPPLSSTFSASPRALASVSASVRHPLSPAQGATNYGHHPSSTPAYFLGGQHLEELARLDVSAGAHYPPHRHPMYQPVEEQKRLIAIATAQLRAPAPVQATTAATTAASSSSSAPDEGNKPHEKR